MAERHTENKEDASPSDTEPPAESVENVSPEPVDAPNDSGITIRGCGATRFPRTV